MNGYGRWGYITLAIVAAGALQTVYGQGDENPVHVTGKGIPWAVEAGDPEASMAQMREAYRVMKANGFDPRKLPLDLLKSPDHHLAEEPMNRDPKATTYAVPWNTQPDEVVMYTGLYFRRNITVYKNRSECRPEGFFLVMFKNGRLVKVPGQDVRLIPAENSEEPSAMDLCFPGMRKYKTSLPRLPEYQDPWYKGPPLDPKA